MKDQTAGEQAMWRAFASRNQHKPVIDDEIGRYKSQVLLEILRKWISNFDNRRILKTDLREEAYGKDEVLFSLSKYGRNMHIFGIDIAQETVRDAENRQAKSSLRQQYITADVRSLPFKADYFDIIVSTSTLDHFNSKNELVRSLMELKRVLIPGGIFILIINNRLNINFMFWLCLERLLRRNSYPVNFYTSGQIRKICSEAGLCVLEEDTIVNIISPMNSMLLMLRSVMPESIVNKISGVFVRIARTLYQNKYTKRSSGWFIALKCTKAPPGGIQD